MASSGGSGRLVTLADAAHTLGVSVRTVRRFIEYGYLKGFRVGPRSIRVRAADVDGLLRRLPGGYPEGLTDDGDAGTGEAETT